MKTIRKIENLGRKFEASNDTNLRTALLRRMMCLFLNLVFYIALRAVDTKKLRRSDIFKNKDEYENIIEEGKDYVIVEWQITDSSKKDKYNVNDIYLYCKFIFNKNGICKRIEVE